MAPIRTRTNVYATPTHKKTSQSQMSAMKSAAKARSNDRLAGKNLTETVGVYLRIRPIGRVDGSPSLAKIDDQQVQTCPPDGSEPQVYKFTKVFDNAPQSEVFEKVARPVAEEFMNSAKDGLIFTYGVSDSGKTYTMEGKKSDPGLIYRTIDFIFNSIGSQQTKKNVIEYDGQNSYNINEQEQLYPDLARPETMSNLPSTVKWQNRTKETASISLDPTAYYCLFISLIELYNKHVYDLLVDERGTDKKRPEIRTDQKGMAYVANASEIEVKSADEAVRRYTEGIKRRHSAPTGLNSESSRGHCVLNLKLVQVRKSYDDNFNEDTLISSQLCLVDLAGSERAKRSGTVGGALHEAGNINNSLGALRKCIRALRDREPTNSIQYREYTLTRLFKSYFEGHGSVRMVLCVKPSAEDFQENNIAMEFGLLTQDVAIDYASPPKQLKRSKNRGQTDSNLNMMYDYFDRKFSHCEPNSNLKDEQFIENWIEKLKSNRDVKRKYIETLHGAQNEVRQNILRTSNENSSLRQLYETRAKELKIREEQIENIESTKNSKIKNLERTVKKLEMDNGDKDRLIQELNSARRMVQKMSHRQAQYDKLYRDLANLMETEETKAEYLKRAMQLLSSAPSAPEMEPLQSSSPVDFPVASTSETSDSNQTPAPTTNSSTEAVEMQDHDHAQQHSPDRSNVLASPTNCVPIVNPRHNRSLSCSSMQWIHHKPSGTIDTGTVMKPKFKNGRSVKNLRSSDILRKDAAGYSVVHQDADQNGDVETSIYKGHIISTVCGGAQVILNDVETMRQVSPKRKRRAASDAHYTH